MARFIVAMNVSLDGYVDHDRFAPDPALFRHWIDAVGQTSAAIYGRRMYELMQYWDENQPGWGAEEHAFAAAWRRQAKHVVSRTLSTVGPNATLIGADIEATLRGLKDSLPGEVDICGTVLTQSLTDMGLMDEYRLYYHPVVLGQGRPFFPAARPRLRLTSSGRIGDEAIRLVFVPA